MSNIYDTDAKNLTFGDISDAIDTLNTIAKDPAVQKMFRKALETSFNPEMIQLIRDLHSDTEEFCDGMREFITDPEEGLDEMDAGLR
tara:strand:- start:313 stop:573 length:261 start_codon:yes stop_codon:yes gene_type:complete